MVQFLGWIYFFINKLLKEEIVEKYGKYERVIEGVPTPQITATTWAVSIYVLLTIHWIGIMGCVDYVDCIWSINEDHITSENIFERLN